MKILILIIIAVAVLYCSFCLYYYLNQDSFLYHPNKNVYLYPDTVNLKYEDIYLTTQNSVKINAWYIPAESKMAKTILCCHGNAGNISNRLETIEIFHNLGLNVFIFDYEGFGKSEGYPSEQGTYQDALTAWNYLIKEKKCNSDDIVIFGQSLGGAIAANLAVKVNPAGLIIESTFTSISEIGQKMFPLFPVSLLLKNKYSSIDIISEVKCPVLVIHSREDYLTPYFHGEKLFDKISAEKHFLEITGGHNEGFLESGETYIDGIKNFIDSVI